MPIRVAIVEDEAIIAMDLERRLRGLGYLVVSAVANGEEALREVGEHRPDLVLMDIRLEGQIDGIDTAREIRDRYRTPVVFLTSHTDEGAIQRAKNSSAFGYLAKPFAERELHATMQFALHRAALENEIDTQRSWLRVILNSIEDGVIAVTNENAVRFMNPAAERLTGARESDALGRPLESVLRVEPAGTGAVCVSASGDRTPVRVASIPIADGPRAGTVLALHDLTSSHAAAEALNLLATVVESSDDAIIGLDCQGSITEWNASAEKLFGCSREEAAGKPISQVAGDSAWGAALEQLRAGSTVRGLEVVHTAADGREIALSLSAAPIWDAHARVAGISCIARDVTERRRAEREIERMNAALHRLSGDLLRLQDAERRRIARELHDSTAQTMAAISMHIVRLDDDALSSSERRRLLAEAMEMTQGCSRELRSLSYLLHPPLLDDLGLDCALRTFIEGYRRRTGVNVSVEVGDVGKLDLDLETALFRIVQESLTNIYKHSESSDAVVVLRREGGHVVLEVTDHGRGLGPETESGFGVGILGMRERARHLAGELEIFNHGAGATVRAVFPLDRTA